MSILLALLSVKKTIYSLMKGVFMNTVSKLYFYFLMIQFLPIFTKFYNSEHWASTSTIIMDNKKFTHTKKSDNGTISEQFLINDVPVEQDEFNNELNSLKLAQMNQQDKNTQRKINEQESMKHNLKMAVLEKLIKQSLTNLQNTLSTLEESILQPYLTFNAQSIKNQSDLEMIKDWTSALHKNLKSTLANQNYQTLQQLTLEIETKVDQAHQCLKQSIQKATSQCDDTATLKKLFTLIES